MRWLALCAPLALLALGACDYGIDDISEVPDNPTYEADVQPLLHDHCTLCHSVPALRGAPGRFRLDQWEDDESGRPGVRSMAGSIVKEVKDDEMPPGAAWGDGVGPNGKKLLERWRDQGFPR